MPLARRILTLLTAFFTSGTFANDIGEEAVRNGYQRLPNALPAPGGSSATIEPSVFVKILEARRKLSIIDTAVKVKEPNADYSIVGFEVDCQNLSVRYRSAQLLELPWNPKASTVRRLRGPWHTPAKASISERALSFACKA